jgi:competence protein ComEC
MTKTAIGFLLGCLTVFSLKTVPDSLWLIGFALLAMLMAYWRLWFFSALFAGLLWTSFQATLTLDDQLAASAKLDKLVTGSIVSVPEVDADRLRFVFSPNEQYVSLPKQLLISWYYPPDIVPKAGEQWQLSLRLKPPHGLSNPAGFDYERWLFTHHYGATGYVRSGDNHRIAAAPWWSVNRLRQHLAKQMLNSDPDSEFIGIYQGLSLGLRDFISTQQWQLFRKTGTSHLVAISGLHIGLMSALGFWLAWSLWRRHPRLIEWMPASSAAAVFAIVIASLYGVLAGLSIPTQRALLIVISGLTALALFRRAQPATLLSFSLLIVLLIDPFSVLSIGFWLSYAAVALILYVVQGRHPAPAKLWIKLPLLILIGLGPLVVFFFHSVSVLSPVANLIAVPVISFLVLPLSLMGMTLSSISSSIAQPVFCLNDQIMTGLWQLLSSIANIKFNLLSLTHLSVLSLFFAVLAALILLMPRALSVRWLGLILLLPALSTQAEHPKAGQVWVTALDVGQGLAMVIETQHHSMVFDTGPAYGQHFNAGQSVLLPYLAQQQIKQLDRLIVSHGDNDHIGGASAVLNAIKVDSIISSVAGKLPAALPCKDGQHWQWDGVKFSVFRATKVKNSADNNHSCVLKISSPQKRFLLTGDIEKEAEQSLIQQHGKALKVDVLIIAHHGSDSSSSEAFLAATDPSVAVISSGYMNRYHFPATAVLSRLQQRHIQTYNTAKSGAVLIRPQGDDGIKIIEWRKKSQHLWTAMATE